MSAFRHRRLRWGVTALLLLTGLCAQMQLLFACELMEGAPTLVCCCDAEATANGCESGGGCLTHAGGAAEACCEITLAPSAGVTAATPAPQGQLLTLIDVTQLPPIVLPLATIHLRPHTNTLTELAITHAGFWLTGTQTYLFTNRFRI